LRSPKIRGSYPSRWPNKRHSNGAIKIHEPVGCDKRYRSISARVCGTLATESRDESSPRSQNRKQIYHPQGLLVSQRVPDTGVKNTGGKKTPKKTKQENFRTPPEITFSAAKLSTRKRLLGVCVCVGAAIRIKPWPASRSRTSSWPTRLRRAFKTTENKYLAAPRGVRAQHYSLPRHTHARTHTLQLVTNIADDSCEKLISFHVHQVGCDVGVARNFSARLDESRRFSILHSRLD
jgi:hypothetical protein